ncbi:hypothetical protein [uncultured Bifidobacterium sp.]|uniref:hypothetical protein n=1 Tax=uncultured Bifidobacterium sp. TaxID=165187 RepID=UPI0025E4EC7F|nr:hypothetical protein [uncultured Bifidobacterium sp.]
MKNLKPISAPETGTRDLGAVFSAGSPSVAPSPSPAGTGAGLWVQTSIKMRDGTRRSVKLYALEHGMKMQEVIDLALHDYLGGRS